MTIADDLMVALSQAAELLRKADQPDWANVMDDGKLRVQRDPRGGAGDIKSLFGGSGTFNDLVLHRAGVPLIEENDQLDQLRERIYRDAKTLMVT